MPFFFRLLLGLWLASLTPAQAQGIAGDGMQDILGSPEMVRLQLEFARTAPIGVTSGDDAAKMQYYGYLLSLQRDRVQNDQALKAKYDALVKAMLLNAWQSDSLIHGGRKTPAVQALLNGLNGATEFAPRIPPEPVLTSDPGRADGGASGAPLDGSYTSRRVIRDVDSDDTRTETCVAHVNGTTVRVEYVYHSENFAQWMLNVTLSGHFWPPQQDGVHFEVTSNKDNAALGFAPGEISGEWIQMRDGWGQDDYRRQTVRQTEDRYWFFKTGDGGKSYFLKWAAVRDDGGDAGGECAFDPATAGQTGNAQYDVTISNGMAR